MKPGRKVLWEREEKTVPLGYLVSLPLAPEYTWRALLPEALEQIATAQRFAEAEWRRPCTLELVATVQHGNPIPQSFTLHFEVTPCGSSGV
jgi:hypothetical protein